MPKTEILEIEYQTVLQQAQTLFEMFLRAIGSRGLRNFMESNSTITKPLVTRYLTLTTNSKKNNAGRIYSMLCILQN